MKTILLAAGAVAAVLTAGQALAATPHRASGSAAIAGPKQPIPYAELSAYLKASPKQRASKDWWPEAQASTGASANTTATTTAGADQPSSAGASSATPAAPPPTAETPPVNTPSASETTTPPAAETPAAPVNPPPK